MSWQIGETSDYKPLQSFTNWTIERQMIKSLEKIEFFSFYKLKPKFKPYLRIFSPNTFISPLIFQEELNI